MKNDTENKENTSAGNSGEPRRGDAFSREGRSRWTRPSAMAKDRNSSAWLYFLAFVCLVVALWVPITNLYWKVRNKSVLAGRNAPRVADCFLTISYEGVADASEKSGLYTTPDVFKSHIIALRDAGYNPIGLEDVRAFYYDGQKLPEKAILLTFENSHKSTYFEIRDFLGEQKWNATMGVVTDNVRKDDVDTILRPYLKNMVNNVLWDLACESDKGTSMIPVTPQKRLAPFFSSPMWLAEEKRYEKFEEFQNRIEADHLAAIDEFENGIGTTPLAFFFPLGNYGQYDENNRVLREANLSAVARHYKLGFILNNQALNERETDRRRLNRMSVPPTTTAEQLVTMLDNAWPVQSSKNKGMAEGSINVSRWVEDWGMIEKNGSAFTLRSSPASDQRLSDDDATGGARAWVSGSSSFRDGTFETRFRLVRGEFHAYLRFRADDNWVQAVVTENGEAAVSQCLPGNAPELLATTTIRNVADFRTLHNLFVTIRDNLVYVRLDGALLFNGPVRLRNNPENSAGLIGLSVWAAEPGLAQSEVYESIVRSRSDAVITWAPSINRETEYIVDQLTESAFRYTIIAPPWLDVYPSAPITFPAIDSMAISLIAKANDSRIFPMLSVHSEAALPFIDKRDVIQKLKEENADGIFIEAGDYPVDKISALKSWLKDFNTLLKDTNFGVAVRFPSSVLQMATISSSFDFSSKMLLVDELGDAPSGIPSEYVYRRIVIAPPTDDEDLSTFYQITDYNEVEIDALPTNESFRRRGLKAYSEGHYSTATNMWAQWRDLEPNNPEVWTFLGNALVRMRDEYGAIDAYGEALKLDPGRIDLMIERARIMETAGRDEEAVELLDTYARAFPNNTRISVAQANWLNRHEKRQAARSLLSNVVTNNPADLDTRLTLQNFLDTPDERYKNMHEVLKHGSGGGPSQLLGFGHDIERSEILCMPESSVFFDFIRENATNAPAENVRELFSDFMPFTEKVVEQFDATRLSDNWTAYGTALATIAGAYNLQAAADMAEAYLRLKHSELIRDGYIEVTLGESVGAFWLYARRSANSMIRFGFDGDGYIRIQSWVNGDVRTSDSHSWIRPVGDITLRLEVRGDGAIGLVDGKRMFSSPLQIPWNIAYGWWSIAPFSPEVGIARARIGRIEAGPMNPSIVFMREFDSVKVAETLDSFREKINSISAISPVVFMQAPDGHVLTTPLTDLMPFKMFCSYHRIRLMPTVELAYYSDVRPDSLVKIINDNHLSGLILAVRSMPKEEWFREMTELMESTTADLIVIQRDFPLFSDKPVPREKRPVTLREIQRGSVIFQPNQYIWTVPFQNFSEWVPGKSPTLSVPEISIVRDPELIAAEAELDLAEAEAERAKAEAAANGEKDKADGEVADGAKADDAKDDAADGAAKDAVEEAKDASDAVKDASGKADAAVNEDAAATKSTLEKATGKAKEAASDVADKAKEVAEKVTDTVKDAAEKVLPKVGETQPVVLPSLDVPVK